MSLRQRLNAQHEPAASETPDDVGDPGNSQASHEHFRTQILPSQVARAWSDVEALRAVLALGLREGCADLLADAARRLRDIDADARTAVLLEAFVLIENGSGAEAERNLLQHMGHHGDDPDLLATLADAYWIQGKSGLARRVLHDVLAVDPANDGALWRLEEYFGSAA